MDGSRISYRLPVVPPDELLNQEMAEHGEELKAKLAAAVRDDNLPSVYTDHPAVQANGNKVQPIVIYLDGAPTTKKRRSLGRVGVFRSQPKTPPLCSYQKVPFV